MGVTFNWPDEAIDLLRARHAAGDSATQTACAIKVQFGHDLSRNAVIGKLHRLGIVREAKALKDALRAGGNTNKGKGKVTPFATGFQRPKLKLVIAGKNAVLVVPAASAPKLPPPREIDVSVAAEPKPWLERKFGECAWPVDGAGADTRSCCNPTARATYCRTHDAVRVGSMPKTWAGFSKPGFAKVMGR